MRRSVQIASASAAIPYLIALAIYLGSRLVIALAINFASVYLQLKNSSEWYAAENWPHHLLRWDSNWYARIAAGGYDYNANPNDFQTVVFYPLYPLASRLVSSLFGIGIGDALLIVANLSAVAAVLLLFRLVRESHGDRVAGLTIGCLSFFPGSLFLSAGYTEATALAFIASCFLALKAERYLLAAAFAGLTFATRSVGLALIPVLAWELWRKFGHEPRRLLRHGVPVLLIAVSGLAAYMVYLWAAFGDPLAFSAAQAAFHAGTTQSGRLLNAVLLEPFTRWRWLDFSPSGLDQWFFVMFVALIAAGWRLLSPAMLIFAAGVVLLPYLTLSGGPSGFTSTARFGLLAFPAFIVLAQALSLRPWLGAPVFGLFGAILFMYAALFAQWDWVG